MPYHEEEDITTEEGERIFQAGNWEFVAYSTCGEVWWSPDTGELLFENAHKNGGCYQIRRKIP